LRISKLFQVEVIHLRELSLAKSTKVSTTLLLISQL